jgi:hypothetical protein
MAASAEPRLARLARYRSSVIMVVILAVVIVAATVAGKHGGGAAGNVKVTFGTRVQQLGATNDLVYTNGWVAGSGSQDIGVYAGSETSGRQNGLFLVVRRMRAGQKLTRVVVRGSGAVTLLRPGAPATESAAFSATLHFVTANGATGTLSLSNDRVALSR